jgi:serine/threonine-protein kinase
MPLCPECGWHSEILAERCPNDEFYTVRDQAAPKRRKEPLLGTCLVHNYVLVDCLGSGMNGTVFEAVHLRLDSRVAIKVLRREGQVDPTQGKRFRREARAIALLDHPNIVKTFDYDLQNHMAFIVMEFVDCKLLTSLEPYHELSQPALLRILIQILSALAEAHDCGIIHRDLKPDNIAISHLVGHPFLVRILDFGLAKLSEDCELTVVTQHGEVLGTPLYMSPEQAIGEPSSAGVDIYAFGVLAFELITGRPPYNAPTALALMMQHVHNPVPPIIPRQGISCSDGLTDVIRRCLAKRPTDRFKSVHEVIKALESTQEMLSLQSRCYDVWQGGQQATPIPWPEPSNHSRAANPNLRSRSSTTGTRQ